MSLLWDYYWPALVAAMVVGVVAGALAYGSPRARRWLPGRNRALPVGGLAALAITALWHGPLGAGDRLAARVEASAAAELVRLEMAPVRPRLQRGPLRRRLVLAGPADDFQQRELVRIMGEIPGVSSVGWANPPSVEAR